MSGARQGHDMTLTSHATRGRTPEPLRFDLTIRTLGLGLIASLVFVTVLGCAARRPAGPADSTTHRGPYVIVLGIAQDAGIPQAGAHEHPAWTDPGARRLVTCIAIVDPDSGRRWMFEATPDFREQLHVLAHAPPPAPDPPLSGIFLTHAHIGHYTGLMFLGHESMGARAVPVYAMPRMRVFLRANGPWDQLVRRKNVELRRLADATPVRLTDSITVTPFLVPHRQEYSEVVGFRIEGPRRTVLFIPDIDSWEQWDQWGTRIEDMLATADIAYLDATFFADGEIPGRDMSGFPHPFITHTIERLAPLPEPERRKVRFIHLNHTNPAQFPDSAARRAVEAAGMRIAEPLERTPL